MAPPVHIQELARQVRTDTVRVLDAAEPAWLMWVPPGTNNHLLWHAGHALWLGDVLGVGLLSGHSELPDGWAETFGQNCRPVAETAEWPGREEVRRRLVEQFHRLSELLDRTPAETLLPSEADGGRGFGIARRIIHGLHDEAKHHGEMKLILKLCHAGHTSVRS